MILYSEVFALNFVFAINPVDLDNLFSADLTHCSLLGYRFKCLNINLGDFDILFIILNIFPGDFEIALGSFDVVFMGFTIAFKEVIIV